MLSMLVLNESPAGGRRAKMLEGRNSVLNLSGVLGEVGENIRCFLVTGVTFEPCAAALFEGDGFGVAKFKSHS